VIPGVYRGREGGLEPWGKKETIISFFLFTDVPGEGHPSKNGLKLKDNISTPPPLRK